MIAVARFFAMGGYALYVWPAFALFFVVLLIDYVTPSLRRRALLRQLKDRYRRQAARQTGTSAPPA